MQFRADEGRGRRQPGRRSAPGHRAQRGLPVMGAPLVVGVGLGVGVLPPSECGSDGRDPDRCYRQCPARAATDNPANGGTDPGTRQCTSHSEAGGDQALMQRRARRQARSQGFGTGGQEPDGGSGQ